MNRLTYQNRSVIHYFGFFGILLWALTYLIRKTGLIFEFRLLAVFWNTPHVAFAWILIAMLKQLYRPSFSKSSLIKSSLTIEKYLFIGFYVVIGAFFNEIIFSYFLNISFDMYDLIATGITQLIIFVFALLLGEII